MLHAEGCDELLVHGLVTVLAEDAEQRLPLVQRLQQDIHLMGLADVLVDRQ